jgi:predicted AAA+ superfamily ATPase
LSDTEQVWRPDPIDFFHYRDRDDFEVDIVLEFGSTAVAGVEVKAAATVAESDFRGLRKLREAAVQRFRSGAVLYDGTASVSFGDGLFALPLRRVWELR